MDPEKKKSGLVVAIMKKLKNGKEVEETKVEKNVFILDYEK